MLNNHDVLVSILSVVFAFIWLAALPTIGLLWILGWL